MPNVLEILAGYPWLLQLGGVIGSAIYVGGFALVQCGYTCGNGAGYSLSKIVAALLVLASLIDAFNLGAFLIQVGFIFFGLVGMLRRGEATRFTMSRRRKLDRRTARFLATEAS